MTIFHTAKVLETLLNLQGFGNLEGFLNLQGFGNKVF
jgi:hypothetical protein